MTTTELVPARRTLPAPSEWTAMQQIAQAICNTEFVPTGLRGRPDAALAAILYGREVGIGPMQALKNINIIEGRPAPEAELMVALVRRGGHSISGGATDKEATVTGTRADTGDTMTVTWTIEMAERVGLANKQNWRKYPEAMLWARAASQLCRQLFPDCLNGWSHTPDELGADVVEEGEYETILTGDGKAAPAVDPDGNLFPDERPYAGPPAPEPEPSPFQPPLGATVAEEKGKVGQPGYVTEPQHRNIRRLWKKLIDEFGATDEALRAGLLLEHETEHTSELTKAQASAVITRFKEQAGE